MPGKKPKILHWPDSYPDPSRGKPFHCIFVEEHIKSAALFCESRVLFVSQDAPSMNKWHEKTEHTENGIKVTRFYFSKTLNLQFLNIYIRLVLLSFFLRLIIAERFYPDLIHIHFFPSGLWAALYSRLFSIKTIVTEHWTALVGYPVVSKERLKGAGSVYDHSSWVLPVSAHLKKGIEKNTGVNLEGKSAVIFNSVDTALFCYKPFERSSVAQLICVARMDEQKDIPNLLHALQLVKQKKEVQLRIVGGGDATPFKALAKELGVEGNVSFEGARDKKQIAEWMQQSDLFVLSSIAENSPCVIGEAHCCGVPVVATDVGGVKELVIEGEVVLARSSEQLAEKIIKWLDRSVDRKKISAQATGMFSYEKIGEQLTTIYRQVINEAKN